MWAVEKFSENTIIVQFRDINTGEYVNEIYGKVDVSLAAYDKDRLLYTSDSFGYTKFVTEGDGIGVINMTDLLKSSEKQARIFSDLYKKYTLGLILTISTESTDRFEGFAKAIQLSKIEWIERPFTFPAIEYFKETEIFDLSPIEDRVDNIRDLRANIKQTQMKYLAMKAEYDAQVRNNVDLKLDRSNPWEPATFKNVLTRILEFQAGTLLPAIEYAKVAELDQIQQRLQIVQDLFVVILQDYPKITIDDGEGMPYMDGKLEEYPIEK
jgi:hypothetical protein